MDGSMQYNYSHHNVSYQDMLRVRNSHQAQDLIESKFLLLELGCSEPTLQLCFKIIESTCLSQGVCCLINGEECTERFQKHIDLHYTPFFKRGNSSYDYVWVCSVEGAKAGVWRLCSGGSAWRYL